MKEREKMKKDNIKKISLLGTLIAGTALCVTLPLASCASTTNEETIAPFFKSLSGDVYYSFSNVIANRIVLIDGINGKENVYYLSVKDNEMRVSPETYTDYFYWKINREGSK